MRIDGLLELVDVRRMKARYHGRCKCSAGVWPGNEIAWNTKTRRVVGCQSCDYTGKSPADCPSVGRDDPDLFGGQP